MSKHYFFRCYHCSEWHYSKGRIKRRKCWKCHKTFKFDNSFKFSRICSPMEAVTLIKKLKSREEGKDLSQYLSGRNNVMLKKLA